MGSCNCPREEGTREEFSVTRASENWESGPAETGVLEGCDPPGEAEAGKKCPPGISACASRTVNCRFLCVGLISLACV